MCFFSLNGENWFAALTNKIDIFTSEDIKNISLRIFSILLSTILHTKDEYISLNI